MIDYINKEFLSILKINSPTHIPANTDGNTFKNLLKFVLGIFFLFLLLV